MTFTIAKRSSLPLYYQLKSYLLEMIASGELAPGQLLPSERQLQEQYSISRATVRQALGELVNEGVLERYHGIGTRVARKKISPQQARLTSFSEDMRSRGLTPGSRTLQVEHIAPPPQVRAVFDLAGEATVQTVYRLRLADREPVGLQREFIPPWLHIPDQDLWAMPSYYQLLEERYRVQIHHAQEIVTAKSATSHEAELLHVDEGQALINRERIAYDEQARTVEYVHFVYRADRYQFELTLYR